MVENDERKRLAVGICRDDLDPGVIPSLRHSLKQVQDEKMVLPRDDDWAGSVGRRVRNVT
jgi:hypothetical protein